MSWASQNAKKKKKRNAGGQLTEIFFNLIFFFYIIMLFETYYIYIVHGAPIILSVFNGFSYALSRSSRDRMEQYKKKNRET